MIRLFVKYGFSILKPSGPVPDLLVFISVFDRFNEVKSLNVELIILGVIKKCICVNL